MNAVIYARYSSHSQTEQSIEGQLHDNRLWAQQQGITVVGEYIDRALTGTKDQRPDFQRMIEDAAKRQFGMVIVWKLDRFARNRYDSAIYKARLKKYGVRVVSVKENITDSPEGIILEGLLESMAEYYSANLSQNIRRGQRESVANGTYCGGPIPYGYRIENKKLVADDKLAPVVRYIFEQYADGVPKKRIIDDLTARGVRLRNGRPLSYSSFSHVLSNRAYIGQFVYSGQVVPGVAQPIIDEALFARVQERLKLNARTPAKQKAKVDYLLTGKIWCGHCGAPMAGDSGKSHTGTCHNYYACRNRKQHRACNKKNERKDDIERYIVEQTVQYVLASDRIHRVAKAVAAEYKKEFSGSRVDELEKSLAQTERELNKLVDALIEAPKAAHQRIYDRMEALEAQKADLSADLARLRVASGIGLSEQEVCAWLRQYTKGDPDDPDFRARIINTFINAVYLYDDRLVVFYNIRGGRTVTYPDLLASTVHPSLPPSDSSDLNANAPPKASKSEPQYVFVNGVFGCVFHRMKDVS